MQKLFNTTLMLLLMCSLIHSGIAQELHEELALESSMIQAEHSGSDINDQQGHLFRKKWNINKVTAGQLQQLEMLTPLQIEAFLQYRKTMGDFISLHELQSIPYWNLPLIRLVMPHLELVTEQPLAPLLKQRLQESSRMLSYRTGGKIQHGYNEQSGRQSKLLLVRSGFRDLMQWGITAESDAGEKKIPDHLSAYLHLSNLGKIKQLIIGDFLVNMGQGLVIWQGYALGMSSNLLSGYRQGTVFKAHTGTDENRFNRGVAISLQTQSLEWSVYAGYHRVDGNILLDSLTGKQWISAIQTSGLHRTNAELADRKSVATTGFGGRLKWHGKNTGTSLNMASSHFSLPIQKRNMPYNQHEISGANWFNISLDQSWSGRLGFSFGEWALDKHGKLAFTGGWIKSIDNKFDLAIMARNMHHAYRSLFANCLSSNGDAGNEKGLFLSWHVTLHPRHVLDGFLDSYRHETPTFLADGPSQGMTSAFQYQWKPNRKTEMLIRWMRDENQVNAGTGAGKTNLLGISISHHLRWHLSCQPLENITIRMRAEWIRSHQEYGNPSQGYLTYVEWIYKPPLQPFSLSIRHTRYETDDYRNRIYAYERDLPSYYAVPAHYGSGSRTYVLANYELGRRLQLSGKWLMQKHAGFISHDWRLQANWYLKKEGE